MGAKPAKCIRLACRGCDRNDWDGITAKQLQKLIATNEVIDVTEVQSYEESRDLESKLDEWYTHMGECRQCRIDAFGEEYADDMAQGSLF